MSCQDSLFIDMLIANPFKIWLKVRQRGSERGVICCGLHAGASACVVHHWLLSDLKRCRCCRQHVITRGESLYWICGWGYCLCRQKSSSFGHCFEVKSRHKKNISYKEISLDWSHLVTFGCIWSHWLVLRPSNSEIRALIIIMAVSNTVKFITPGHKWSHWSHLSP